MDERVQNTAYDVEAIRRDFPILSREVYGKPLVYLDNGASAQKPQVVIDAVAHAYANEYANVHRGLHFLSNAATEAYEAAREKVRRFLNAPSPDNIIFTKSSTEAINTVAYGYGMPKLGEGDDKTDGTREVFSVFEPNQKYQYILVFLTNLPPAENGNGYRVSVNNIVVTGY